MQQSETKTVVDYFVGHSDWTRNVRKRITQVANFRYNVLVTGPSGTGKELVARAIHSASDRNDRPFIPVNCAAIPGSLFSSQLFGHVKGAFTGAQHAALGCFRAADGGTLFLDEIGDLDLDSQAKLLRVLQERKVTPVGGLDDIDVDVRTIAATNRNLAAEVQAGRFRLDLYYRLNVLSIDTLGLAQRLADIEPLAKHFLAKAALESGLPFRELTPGAIRALHGYHWPGNVRELQNTIERALVMSEATEIDASDVRTVLASTSSSATTIFAGGMLSATDRVVPTDTKGRGDNSHLSSDAHHEVAATDVDDWDDKNWDNSEDCFPTLAYHARTTATDESSAAADRLVDRRVVGDQTGLGAKLAKEQSDNGYGNHEHDESDCEVRGSDCVDADDWEREWLTLAEMEAQHIRQTLRRTYYNQSAAARLLGVDRKLLARKMKKFGIHPPRRVADLVCD